MQPKSNDPSSTSTVFLTLLLFHLLDLELIGLMNPNLQSLSSIVVITDTETALMVTESGRPGTLHVELSGWDGGVSEQKPETEDWLGEDVKDCVADDLGVWRDLRSALTDSPNTVIRQLEYEDLCRESLTYTGYRHHKIRVKTAMELKRVPTFLS